jgi:hypothetical protein
MFKVYNTLITTINIRTLPSLEAIHRAMGLHTGDAPPKNIKNTTPTIQVFSYSSFQHAFAELLLWIENIKGDMKGWEEGGQMIE